MSRTIRGSKPAGYDYWSRRHPWNGMLRPTKRKWTKRLTHKYERRVAKSKVREFSTIEE